MSGELARAAQGAQRLEWAEVEPVVPESDAGDEPVTGRTYGGEIWAAVFATPWRRLTDYVRDERVVRTVDERLESDLSLG